MSTHSILAPSDSARWLRCVGALYLSKGQPELDREYNASGTCSHWLGQWQLEHPGLDLNDWLGKTLTFGDNPKFDFVIDEERLERVRTYVDAINREPGDLYVEHTLDTTPVLGIPGQQGHADTVKVYAAGGVVKDGNLLRGVVSVHDYKDGYILVNAKDNTQLMIYACAAMMEMSLVGEFQAFRVCVHQPKLHHYDEWTYTRDELIAFMESIRPVAKLAYDIWSGAVKFDPATHLIAGDDQCTWCPVRGSCPARAQYIIDLFRPVLEQHQVTNELLGMILAKIDAVRSALNDYEAEALKRATAGGTIPGQKLVYGNKGRRRWSNPEAASLDMELLLGDGAYKPREPISPTEAEKLLKKDTYAPLAQYVVQGEARLQLVAADDRRKEVVVPQFGLVGQP